MGIAEELPSVVEASLKKKGIVVCDLPAQAELEKRGYGEREGRSLILKDYEALYLHHIGRLAVKRRNRLIERKDLVKMALEKSPNSWTSFLVYRDLRGRGYVVKEGFGFGSDFRVYERGEFQVKPAKYVVFAMNEGTEVSLEKLSDSIDQMVRMGKEPVVAVIERRGEVIYYRISKMRFKEHEP